jgi:hypothetical protein
VSPVPSAPAAQSSRSTNTPQRTAGNKRTQQQAPSQLTSRRFPHVPLTPTTFPTMSQSRRLRCLHRALPPANTARGEASPILCTSTRDPGCRWDYEAVEWWPRGSSNILFVSHEVGVYLECNLDMAVVRAVALWTRRYYDPALTCMQL